MLKHNQYYFEISMAHPEPIWDKKFYPFLQKNVEPKEYKNIIAMESYLNSLMLNPSSKEIEKLFEFLKKSGCEKSYFSFFLRTCDLSLAELINRTYYDDKARIKALKDAVNIYHQKRKHVITDRNSLQAYNDAQTAKRRSDAGECKVIKLSNLKTASSLDDLNRKIARINKSSGQFTMSKIKNKLGIKFKFSKKDKVPDCIFKIDKDVYIVEAKHVKGEGGAQNSSISELISIIELVEDSSNVHYVGFLDGSYTKYLSVTKPNKNGNKLEKQKFRIIETLKRNRGNYFLNTFGFTRLIKDINK